MPIAASRTTPSPLVLVSCHPDGDVIRRSKNRSASDHAVTNSIKGRGFTRTSPFGDRNRRLPAQRGVQPAMNTVLTLPLPLVERLAGGAAAPIDEDLLVLPVEAEELGRDAYGFRTTYGFLGAALALVEPTLDFD